jgi:hypothetical protein
VGRVAALGSKGGGGVGDTVDKRPHRDPSPCKSQPPSPKRAVFFLNGVSSDNTSALPPLLPPSSLLTTSLPLSARERNYYKQNPLRSFQLSRNISFSDVSRVKVPDSPRLAVNGNKAPKAGEGMSHLRTAPVAPAPADGGGCDEVLESTRHSSVCSLLEREREREQEWKRAAEKRRIAGDAQEGGAKGGEVSAAGVE